jgi:hypothetical protein
MYDVIYRIIMSSYKKTRRTTQGGLKLPSFKMPSLGSIHNFVKNNRLISRGADKIGFNTVSRVASSLGYGKRKKRKRTTMGGSMFGKILSKITSLPLGLIGGALGGLQNSVSGLGRRRRVGRRRVRGGRHVLVTKGRGVLSAAKKALSFLKKHKVLSNAASNIGFHKVGKALETVGLGSRRRVVRRPVRGGRYLPAYM